MWELYSSILKFPVDCIARLIYDIDFIRVRSQSDSIWHFHHKLDGARSHPLFTLYKLPRRITYGLPLPTRGLISDIEPEKEGRASPREERCQYADILTRYPTYPFAFSTYARTGPREWGDEMRRERDSRRGSVCCLLCSSLSMTKSRDV